MGNWMRKIAMSVLLLAAAGATASTPEQWAAQVGIDLNVSYEATRVMRTDSMTIEMLERRAPQKTRMEMTQQGMNIIMIQREDKGLAYAVMPDMGFYREIPLAEAQGQTGTGDVDLSDFEKIGTERVNGYKCTKYRGTFNSADAKGNGTIWVADNGVAIKMDMSIANEGQQTQDFTMELRDLKLRAQDPGYFELPAGLQSMNNLGGMGAIGAQMRQQQAAEQQGQVGEAPAKPQQPTMADEIGQAVEEETRQGVNEGVRDKVREGIRGLFRR